MKLNFLILPFAALIALAGCSSLPRTSYFGGGGGNVPILASASIIENRTPVDDAMQCYGEALINGRKNVAPLGIAVGEVRDFTGRINDQEGAPITQGAGPMVYSSLAGIGSSIRVHERLDPRVAELELAYMDRQRLGDGRMHRASPSAAPAPWLPYMGGSILQSDYYIVGGVTELNNSISSGGAEATIGGIGARARYAVINVAVDLRIVNTRTLVVEHAVSMQKQVIGQEMGIDVFRFFGTRLFDIKAGSQMTEPMQIAVRSILQLATLDLLEAVSGIPNEPCVRKVQPNLDRKLPRPQPSSKKMKWPPDSRTAVSNQETAANKNAATQREIASNLSIPAVAIPEKNVVAAPKSEPQGATVIGAATNAEAAQKLWGRLRQDNEELLSEVEADLVSVGRAEGPFLILVAHREKSPAQFCEEAKTVGIECEVAPPQVIAARDAVRKKNEKP
jgi:curli biogenesis system outer membrane secretion channel CsgG